MTVARRYPIGTFVALTYLITWGFQIPVIFFAHGRGIELGNESNFSIFMDMLQGDASGDDRLALLLFNAGQFGPLIAAFVLTGLLYGAPGLRDLLWRSGRTGIPASWYGVVFALPIVLAAVALLGALLSSGFSTGPFEPELSWALFLAFFVYMIVFTGIAEEPGWRGFALPHLQARRTAYNASWALGFMWGAWHIPFTIYYNRDEPALILSATAGLLFGIVGWTIVNTWIYNATSSVFLIILLHGWNNTVQSYLVLSQPSYLAQIVYVLVPWGMAILLARRYGEGHLSASARPTWWPGESHTERRANQDIPHPFAPMAGGSFQADAESPT